jgi:uncharacterized protein involved in outer membrane biogenesis
MKKFLTILVVVLLLVGAAIGIAIATFDINKYRGQLETALSKELGRTVKLGGEIHIGISNGGLAISVRDAAIGNPTWASRPNMAGIGLFSLKVGLMPILEHKVDISGIAIENADIQLESSSGNRHNWQFQTSSEKSSTAEAKKEEASQPVAINIAELSVKNSQVTLRDENGKTTIFKAENFTLKDSSKGASVNFAGSYNTQPIKLAITTNGDSLFSKTARPVDITLDFANYHLTAEGKIDIENKKADINKYELTSNSTKISGHMLAAWGGARPAMQGTLVSDKLVPDDLKMAGGKEEGQAKPEDEAAKPHQRLFNDNPLPFDSLKSADVNLDIEIGTMPAGSVELKNIKTKLVINNGHLLLSPLKINLGEGTMFGQVNLDAANALAHLGVTISINGVDMADLIKVWGTEAFLSGKVKSDINLASSGNTMHELASNLSGPISLIGAGGDVISSAKDRITAGLMEVLAPGSGNKNASMNCLVARFIAQNGNVKSNGILVDTAAATAAGYGDIDLRTETVNLDFHAKTKLIDVAGLLPSVHIGGTLQNPDVNADAKSIIQNVGSLLTGNAVADNVPNIATQQGQNACAYTLDHPTAAQNTQQQKGGVVQDLTGKAGTLLKGLLGK